MQMANQEVRTSFVSAVTWGRRAIFGADPMAHLFLGTLRNNRMQLAESCKEALVGTCPGIPRQFGLGNPGGRSGATGPKGPNQASGRFTGLKPGASTDA